MCDDSYNSAYSRFAWSFGCFGHELILIHPSTLFNSINAQNSVGNTALHFAMAYDLSGRLGELLVKEGADDLVENKSGLTPYDGLD
jgi:ankyrin repeat protein